MNNLPLYQDMDSDILACLALIRSPVFIEHDYGKQVTLYIYPSTDDMFYISHLLNGNTYESIEITNEYIKLDYLDKNSYIFMAAVDHELTKSMKNELKRLDSMHFNKK